MGFIDFDNINITGRTQHNLRFIDFNKFRGVILDGLRCVGCTVYLPYKMQSLLKTIQRSGLEVKVVSPGKSIDGRLIFDLLTNASKDNFDTAVIASGDKDYVYVLEEVKRMKKEVKSARSSITILSFLANRFISSFQFELKPLDCSFPFQFLLPSRLSVFHHSKERIQHNRPRVIIIV